MTTRVRITRRKGETRRRMGSPMSYVDCLVEAMDMDDATQLGLRYVEDTRPSDVRWLNFQWIETAKIKLPIEVS